MRCKLENNWRGRGRGRHRLGVVCLGASLLVRPALGAADWPTYRHDAARSGYTEEQLPATLSPAWSYQLAHPPQPAWPRSGRMTYDRVCQPVVARGLVCFGSSVDGRVYALDAQNGALHWTFFTDGPIRLAPVYANHRFYVASDDGHLYCLEADTGALIWQHRGAPNGELALGNGSMISRWPARGGPVAADGVVYYAAGIWPSDGVYLFALEARSGKVLWANDTTGGIYLGQPHPGANAHSGIAPQGYLAATPDQLLVPNGRAVPAAFRLDDGAFKYFHLQRDGHRGGSAIAIFDQHFINDGVVYERTTGNAADKIQPGPVAVVGKSILCRARKGLLQYRWADKQRVDRRGQTQQYRGLAETRLWPDPDTNSPAAVELIVAGHAALIGYSNRVQRIDLQTTQEVWTARVEGQAGGLAVAAGRLYVSTSEGALYCFAGASQPFRERVEVRPSRAAAPDAQSQRAAKEILERTGMTSGYCLDLGCGPGDLAEELARRTELQIIAVDEDAQAVNRARERFAAAGLYGSRITVRQCKLADTELPEYFANLIVSGRSVREGPAVVPADEVARLQRPYGGVACLGRPGAMQVNVRPPLAGAGDWTHQYGDAGNTLCSSDTLVKGPLGLLWFNDVDQRLVQRHGRAPAPLFHNGILYSEGRDSLVAVDAYNGRLLWEYPLPGILAAYDGDHLMGVSGSGSNFCLSEDSVYVRRKNHCLRLDARTGQLLARFTAPRDTGGRPGEWGFIAYADGRLFGSLANPDHVVTYRYLKGGDLSRQLTESSSLFALDAVRGALQWRYDAQHSIRHNSIAVGAGTVALIDRPLAMYDRKHGAQPTNVMSGELVALSAATGEVLWKNNEDIYGTVLLLSATHNKIVMGYQSTRFRLASEIGGRLSAFDLSTGKRLWDRKARYASRPMLNDDVVLAEGGAWDLATGEEQPFPFQRSYGCGILAGAKQLLVFRSATLGYYDLGADYGTEEFGGVRPGCWINVLPVGGLVLAPDASAGCVCSYPNQAWVALKPDGVRPPLLEPAGATSRHPVTVRLQANRPAVEHIHYTLDGSLPTTNSPAYQRPWQLTQSAVLTARAFGPEQRASRLASGRFVIDPHVLELSPKLWRAWDAPKASPPSLWTLDSTTIAQSANTLLNVGKAMGKSPNAERPGTLYLYLDGYGFKDGVLRFEMQSADNDTVGMAFRAQDPAHYYLWLLDSERGFRALAVKAGKTFKVLATNQRGYQPGKWYAVRVVLNGPRLRVFVGTQLEFDVEDSRFAQGTVAPYSWGNSGVRFRNLRFDPK